MSSVTVNVGTYCEVKADYDGITLAITASVCPAGSVQLQADWNQTDDTAVDFIKNKPTLDDTVTDASENAVKSNGIWAALESLWQSVMDAFELLTASSIVVSDPVSPDYTAAVEGNNLQQVTNKVAGLQDRVIWEEVFEHDITEFELSVDKDGKQLDERGVLILVDGVVSSEPSNNGELRLNSIDSSTYWNSVTNDILNTAIIYCNGAADNIFSGTIECYRNNNNIMIQQFIGNSVATTGNPRTNFYTASLPVSQNITNIHLRGLRWRAGSQIKIYRL